MRGLRDVVGICVGGLRCRKSESVRSTCNSHSEITRACGRSCAAKNGNFKIVRVVHPGHVRLRVEYPKYLVVRTVEIGDQTVSWDCKFQVKATHTGHWLHSTSGAVVG